MRKIIFTVFILAVSLSCRHEKNNEFEVSGTIKNNNAEMIYLEETPLGSGQRIIVDSSVINKDGSFHLKAKSGEESLYHLFLKNEQSPFAFVINDGSKIKLTADMNRRDDYSIEGSPESKSLRDFFMNAGNKMTELSGLRREMDSLSNAGASDSILSGINDKGRMLLIELRNYTKNYITNSPSPISAVWALERYSLFTPEEHQELLNDIAKRFPSHKGLATVKEMNDRQMELVKKREEQPGGPEWIGKEAPELSLPGTDGKEIKLSSFKGKYVLVDFWASWCMPCRKENPSVVKVYNKYKNKNFTILGVSLDKEKADWLKAIQKDKLAWTHISDLQGWSSLAVSTYSFEAIPFNVLVDPNGKIIAQGLRGSDLDTKLQEVLK